mgnify:CR=1 FL=1
MSGAQPAMSSNANNSLQSSAPQVEHCLPIDYLLHLADNALVLGQRNAEWSGHGPILEEDIAMSNNSLDLIGKRVCCTKKQQRNWATVLLKIRWLSFAMSLILKTTHC